MGPACCYGGLWRSVLVPIGSPPRNWHANEAIGRKLWICMAAALMGNTCGQIGVPKAGPRVRLWESGPPAAADTLGTHLYIGIDSVRSCDRGRIL